MYATPAHSLILHLFTHPLQDRKEQRRLVRKGRGEEGPQCSQEEEGEEADGLDPFPDSEAALALLAVKAIPGLTGQ